MISAQVHPTAVVDPDANIGENVRIGPYSVIERGVTIGDDCEIGVHCLVTGRTTIGKNNKFFTGAVVGSIPQDKKFTGHEEVFLTIGDNNIFREYVTVNPGTQDGGAHTVIGSGNLFMAYAHIAHDCRIGNHCIMANAGTLAGHVTLEDRAVVGGLTAVHQFVRLGKMSIVGGCSKVVQDIPPFSTCDGHPAKVFSLNSVGLKRAEVPAQTQKSLRRAFKILFHSGLSRKHALEQMEAELEACEHLDYLMRFVKESKRGICS